MILTEGFIGDLWKAFMWVIFTIAICALAAFLFHFLQISSYQRQASSILQDSTYIPDYGSQVSNASSTGNSTDDKLARLDKRYNYDFVIESDHSHKISGFNNGDRMYYRIYIHIPYMSVGNNYIKSTQSYDNGTKTSSSTDDRKAPNDKTDPDGNYSNSVNQYRYAHRAHFSASIPAKTICQTNDDNDNNSKVSED